VGDVTLRGLLEASPDAMIAVAAGGTISIANPQAERLFGYGAGELVGMRVESLVPERLGDVHRGHRDDYFDDPRARPMGVGLDLRARRKDGSEFPVEISLSALETEEGTLVTAAIRDITERRNAEAKFRALLEAAPDAMIVVDLDGSISLVNARTESTFGYSREELVGRSIESLVDERFKDGTFGDPDARPRDTRLDLHARRKDGSEFPVEISLSPLETEEGTLVTAAIRDITERRNAEVRLRHLAALVESSDEAIIGKTIDGRIVSWNRGAERLYGYSAKEVIGRSISLLMPEDRHHELEEILEQIGRGERIEHRETVRRHKNGGAIEVSLSMSPVIGPEGRVDGAAAISRDITERKQLESQLRFLADHDVLTGLFNRRRFIQELAHQVELSERYGQGGAVLILDLDNFKEINDSLGHGAGDDAVRAVGLALARRLRSSDVLARLGGDEFAVLLPQGDGENARTVAAGLLDALRGHPVFLAGRRVRITTSIGVALFGPGEGLDSEALLSNADIAMYHAKEAGRDRFEVYSPAPQREGPIEARPSWSDRVRGALERGAFSISLQPILDLRSGQVSQYEVLVRMNGEDGPIPPGAFLAAAERSGQVGEVDRWVIRNAIELMARGDVLGSDVKLELNVSGRSIGDAELPEMIGATVAEQGVDPRRLIFAVSEAAANSNMTEAREFASALSGLGCRFALDDFGAGLGSFYYLKHLPLDFLKINGDFIRNLRVSEVDQVLVRGMVEVARGLGIRTVAEFVEDQATLELVREYGVDHAQGFHVGRPRPVESAGKAAAGRDAGGRVSSSAPQAGRGAVMRPRTPARRTSPARRGR
jgi:diguanylate cyclase (GGDEF)-like protein/PAS domain S-box-containing protein